MLQTLYHLLAWSGWIILAVLAIILWRNQPINATATQVASYKKAYGSPGQDSQQNPHPAILAPFIQLMQELDNPDYLNSHTTRVYAAQAQLNDTLVQLNSSQEILQHFQRTAESMDDFQLHVLQAFRADDDYYVRWHMVYSNPQLSSGEPIHSLGISQLRLDSEGKVSHHYDFWDSRQGFFQHVPVIGPQLQILQNKFQ